MTPLDAYQNEALKPTLLFDTDDVICFEADVLCDVLNAGFGLGLEVSKLTQRHPMPIKKKQKKWLNRWHNQPIAYVNLAPDFKAIAAITTLHDEGYHIILSSDRDPSCRQVTQQWYDAWQVPYDAVAVNGPQTKEAIIATHGPNNPIILIDDDARRMFTLPRDGVQVWSPLRPWTPSKIPTQNTWVFTDWVDVLTRLAPQTFVS